MLELAQKTSRRDGVITGRQLGNVFAWMRPDDLVFNYWVSNYLMGVPAADVRHPRLERRQHQPARAAARRVPRIFKNNILRDRAKPRSSGRRSI